MSASRRAAPPSPPSKTWSPSNRRSRNPLRCSIDNARVSGMDANELRHALRIVARILAAGERTHPPDAANHWLKISTREHVARAMKHIDKLLLGANTGDDDLGHA